MKLLQFALLMLVALLWSHGAQADMAASAVWFGAMSEDERILVQADLVLLGHYDKLVDGEFGPGTYAALTAYQASTLSEQSGYLSDAALKQLHQAGNAVAVELGLEFKEDEISQTALVVPVSLIQIEEDQPAGRLYSSEDETFQLQTFRYEGTPESFQGLYATLGANTTARHVNYRTFSEERFVVSGMIDGRHSYVLFRYTPGQMRGFALSWHSARQAEGSAIAVLQASYFIPLEVYRGGLTPPMEQEKKPPDKIAAPAPTTPETPSKGGGYEEIGALAVIDNRDDLIVLSGEITTSTPLDFLRALKARPQATTLLLNSPGGLVDAGLLMAHEVRRRGLTTVVPDGFECLSACSFVFFAGIERDAIGSLGVHQLWNEANNLVSGQAKLSDVLEAMDEFGVSQSVISLMLRTPPDQMHIFTASELERFGIDTVGAQELKLGNRKVLATTASERSSGLADEEELRANLQLALDSYQDALNGAAQGDLLSARTLGRNALARIEALCDAAGYVDTRSCIGSELPPLPEAPSTTGSRPYVQLASFVTRADALLALEKRQAQIRSVLPAATLDILEVNIGQAGIMFRLAVRASNFADAMRDCERLRRRSIDCIPIRGM